MPSGRLGRCTALLDVAVACRHGPGEAAAFLAAVLLEPQILAQGFSNALYDVGFIVHRVLPCICLFGFYDVGSYVGRKV